MKKIVFLVLGLMITSSLGVIQAQQNDEVRNILSKFKNYRFGSIYVYEIIDAEDIKQIIKEKAAAASGGVDLKEAEKAIEGLEPAVKSLIESGVKNESSYDEISEELITQDYDVAPDVLQQAFDFFTKQVFGGDNTETILHAYIIATIPTEIGDIPSDIIGMVLKENEFDINSDDLKENLGDVSSNDDIYSYRRLLGEDLEEGKYGNLDGAPIRTMYDLLRSYFVQGNVTNKTMEARGIGVEGVIYSPKSLGNAEPLIDYSKLSGSIKDRDIQSYKKISGGEPVDYKGKNMEVLISGDRLRWTKYEKPYLRKRGKIKYDSLGNPMIDMRRASNGDLPQFGLELKYGAEDVNMTSFSSERLTASAFWGLAKFGLILPTEGWTDQSMKAIEQERTLTGGGFGVAAELDFPFAIIPRSDVFQLSFAHVFGDAVEASYKEDERGIPTGKITERSFETGIGGFDSRLSSDYLLRTNAKLHYTFGMSIDKDYLLRFGIGGSFYNMETWGYGLDGVDYNIEKGETGRLDSDEYKVQFKKTTSQTVGGVSIRADFLAKASTTPFGATVNYFDESVYLDAFVQIPAIDNTFFIKINAKGTFRLRETENRPWESSESFFMPMLSLIYVF
jgi:hypothetical protein